MAQRLSNNKQPVGCGPPQGSPQRVHVVAETEAGRGIVGVVDGSPPKGVETQEDAATRHRLLRQIGYKL